MVCWVAQVHVGLSLAHIRPILSTPLITSVCRSFRHAAVTDRKTLKARPGGAGQPVNRPHGFVPVN